MIKIDRKENCCGCLNCINSCPQKCIALEKDEEGYVYPKINIDKCINCGICENKCPLLKTKSISQKTTPIVYGLYNKNQKIRKKSTSGGFFYQLAKYVIEHQGIVFGVKYDKNMNVIHDYTEKEQGIFDFMGSKYVQSNVGDIFIKIKDFLKENRLVLFSGTPCQTAALKIFLNQEYDNLICCDFVCEGVPSNYYFDVYKHHYENEYKSKIVKFEFRNKKNGWLNFSNYIEFENGKKKYVFRNEFSLSQLLYSGISTRPSCMECKYKELKSGSDFKMADFWKVSQSENTKYNYYGVSHIVINSEKAKRIFEKVSNNFEVFDSSYEEILKLNNSIKECESSENEKTELLYQIKDKTDEEVFAIINNKFKQTFVKRVKTKFKVILSTLKYINRR